MRQDFVFLQKKKKLKQIMEDHILNPHHRPINNMLLKIVGATKCRSVSSYKRNETPLNWRKERRGKKQKVVVRTFWRYELIPLCSCLCPK